MVILQRWKPAISNTFPSLIPFWIRIKGLPLHYWYDDMVCRVGQDLGTLVNHELTKSTARVRVLIDGLKPLIKEAMVDFDSGEEALITLEYEKLEMHCSLCYSLLHHRRQCPSIRDEAPHDWEEKRRSIEPFHSPIEEEGKTGGPEPTYRYDKKERVSATEKDYRTMPPIVEQKRYGERNFKERMDRYGIPFGDRVSTKQTRNSPPMLRYAEPHQKQSLSWREKPAMEISQTALSPP